MKSRKEYFETRRLTMTVSRICYILSIVLVLVFMIASGGYATIAVCIFLLLTIGVLCSIYAHQQKEFLFCPKCGSKNIVKTGFMGIPVSITDTCPDCKNKINIDKSINKD